MSEWEGLLQQWTIPSPAAQSWVERGGKAMGTVCCYVPEELIDAAGLMPLRVRATGCEEDARGKAEMSAYGCSFARSCLELIYDGKYDLVSGVAATDGCLHAQRLYDFWRMKGLKGEAGYAHLVNAPRLTGDENIDWFKQQILDFKASLEELVGHGIADEEVAASIEKYNKVRALIRQLYELNKGGAPVVSGADMLKVTLAAMSMPKDEFIPLMEAYLADCRTREPIQGSRARLMVVGSACDTPAYVEMLERSGANVVTDAQCYGSRYLWEDVDVDTGDIYQALARTYATRPTCPRVLDTHRSQFDFIAGMAKEYDVDGIVYLTMHNCDLWGGYQWQFDTWAKEIGLPILRIEREQIVLNEGQVGVRVEAFVEMIEEGEE